MKRIIYYILVLLISIISIILAFNATIIPNNILYLILIFYVLLLLLILILLTRKKKFLRFLGILLGLLLIIIDVGIIFVYSKSSSFFDKITNVEYETSNYSIIVLKDSSYEKIDDITKIGIYHNELDKNLTINTKYIMKNLKVLYLL